MSQKFGFLIRSTSPNFDLIWDGTDRKLRNVIDRDEAKRWRATAVQVLGDKAFQKVDFNVNMRKSKNVLPLVTEGTVISEEISTFIQEDKRISSPLKLIWVKFLKKYDVVEHKGVVAFKEKEWYEEESDIPDRGLMLMKDFLFWLTRLEPIGIVTGKDHSGNVSTRDYVFSQDFDGVSTVDIEAGDEVKKEVLRKIPYTYNGSKYETPVYGIYSPQFRDMMFWNLLDFWDGRILQKWQLKLLYEMGEETYLAVTRGAGKSFIAAFLASVFLVKSVTDVRQSVDGTLIHVLGLNHDSNAGIIKKIMNLNKDLRDNKFFKYSTGDKSLHFMDKWDVVGSIRFLSNESSDPGRGDRPTMLIVDEAARIDKENVLGIVGGNPGIVKFYISTIDAKTKKNWFYEGLMRGEFAMNNYKESMDDIVYDLWHRYGLDKIKSREELMTKEWKKKLVTAQADLFDRRPLVGMRFTLDDVEFKTEREKKKMFEENLRIGGLKYALAELYSEYLDDELLLDYEPCIDPDRPKEFDEIVMGFDEATEYDYPALCIAGLHNRDVYILECVRLPSDNDEKLETIKNKKDEYRRKYGVSPIFIADITQARAEQRYFLESRGIDVDMGLVITGGGDYKTKNWEVLVGKSLLINVAKMFFGRRTIHLNDDLGGDDGLLTEISNFEAEVRDSGNVVYRAARGKDDQVMAMLYCLFYLYQAGLKDEYAKVDVRSMKKKELGDIDYMEWIDQMNKKLNKKEAVDELLDDLYGTNIF